MEKQFKNKKVNCDYCNGEGPTARTDWGTSNYTRFICKSCYDRIVKNNTALGEPENKPRLNEEVDEHRKALAR